MSEAGSGETTANPVEIERKFLIDPNLLPNNLEEYPHKLIRQGYMVIGADGSEARVRDKGGSYTQTIKSKGTLSRGEWEIEITDEQFETLWPSTEGRRVEKTRFTIPYGDHTIEIDIYEGDLAGLVTAEIEFGDETTAQAFEAPDWLGSDVTEDARYKNQNLAQSGIPELI